MTPEEKLLRLIIKDQMADKNYPVKQITPFCEKCRIEIDILDEAIKVDFREIEIGSKSYFVAEPYCPRCFTKIPAKVFLVS